MPAFLEILVLAKSRVSLGNVRNWSEWVYKPTWNCRLQGQVGFVVMKQYETYSKTRHQKTFEPFPPTPPNKGPVLPKQPLSCRWRERSPQWPVAVGSAGFHVRVLAAETTIYGRNYISSELKSYLINSDHISKSSSHPSLSTCFCLSFLLPMSCASCAMSSEGEPNGPWCSTGAKALNAPGEFDQVDLPRPPAPRKASRGKTPWRESYIKMSYNHHRIWYIYI